MLLQPLRDGPTVVFVMTPNGFSSDTDTIPLEDPQLLAAHWLLLLSGLTGTPRNLTRLFMNPLLTCTHLFSRHVLSAIHTPGMRGSP